MQAQMFLRIGFTNCNIIENVIGILLNNIIDWCTEKTQRLSFLAKYNKKNLLVIGKIWLKFMKKIPR